MVAKREADDGETARASARGRQGVGGDIPNGVQGAREGKLSDCHSRVLELGLMCHRHQKATGQQSTTMARRGANDSPRVYCNFSQHGSSSQPSSLPPLPALLSALLSALLIALLHVPH